MPSQAQIAADEVAAKVQGMLHPLKRVCADWLSKIKLADRNKEEIFTQYAREAQNFFDGPHDYMWSVESTRMKQQKGFAERGSLPMFQISVNKIFEAVALFGPAMYYQNPQYTVSHVKLPVPAPEAFIQADPAILQQLMMEQMAKEVARATQSEYIQHYLNWDIRESGMNDQAKRVVEEAIIKGLGCWWIDMYEAEDGSVRYPMPEYMSCDDLQVDPDATKWEDVQWISRRRCEPLNLVERKFGLPAGSLRGQKKTLNQQATQQGDAGRAERLSDGQSFDMFEYHEVYSKNGFGNRLYNAPKDTQQPSNIGTPEQLDMEWAGDYCRIVVAEGVDFPLNLPSWLVNGEMPVDDAMVKQAVEWPTPYYVDKHCAGGWPLVRCFFYGKPNSVWPISIFKPVVGPLKFVNWCMSFLADRVAAGCTTYLFMRKAIAAEFNKQVKSASGPYKMIDVGADLSESIKDGINMVSAPEVGNSIWQMLTEAMELIDKGTGLTELQYGLSSRQMRSAAEANVKNQNISVRPDDMANKVEAALGQVGVKLMECARWHLSGQDVAPVLGELGAMVWDGQILMDGPDAIVRDYHFSVEAGSARRKNKQEEVAKVQELGQVVMPVYMTYFTATGDPSPINAYITDWCKANDKDPQPYLMAPMPPPVPPGEENGKPDGEGKKRDSGDSGKGAKGS